MRIKLIVFGASGLLGSNIIKLLHDKYNILGIYNKNKPNFSNSTNVKLLKFNLIKHVSINNILIKKFKPRFIINCAGESSVDECELKKKYAYQSIYLSTKKISEFAKKNKAYLINVSTDSLYDGKKKFYTENSKTKSLNYYSKLKLKAERYLVSKNKNSLIVRTRFYGKSLFKKNNFFEEIIINLKNKKTVNCYSNVYSTQISVINLVKIFDECFKKKIYGIYNIVGDERLSRLEFAMRIAKVYKLNYKLINPIKFNFKKSFPKKSLDTSLSNKKIKKIIKTNIMKINKSLINS